MKSIEIFTGAGGLALGTHVAGFHHRALIEWNKDACDTLRRNAAEDALPGIRKWNVIQGDIRTVQFRVFGEVDLVAGGAPCQPFSLGGKHRGMDDPRNMIPEYVRCVREFQPRAFILENVKGLLRESFSSYFSYVILQLNYPTHMRKADEDWTEHLRRLEDVHTRGRYQGLRYNVVFQLLNAADYGVPQQRERVFVVGFRSDLNVEWHFPEPTHSYDALMRDQWVTGDYWKRHGVRRPSVEMSPAMERAKRLAQGDMFASAKPWVTIRDAIHGLPEPRHDREPSDVFNHRLNLGAKPYPGHTGSPLDMPSKALKAGVHGVPGGENMIALPDGQVRYLTVREAARVQSFPDGWRFEGSWSEAMRQLGNAVPMELAAVVARSVAKKLRSVDAN
jgi:DNA (cytosine-5)-methyltransferase 1